MKTLLAFSASLALGFLGIKMYQKEPAKTQTIAAKIMAPICPAYPEIKATAEELSPPLYKHCEKCLTGVYRKDETSGEETCSFCYRPL
jgi:hypothetical protein